MNNQIPIDEASRQGATPRVVTDPDQSDRLRKRSRRMGVLAVIACPCHLPLVATVLALIGFGGSAAALRDNLVVVSVVFATIFVASLWLAIRSSRAANACALPPPPVPPSPATDR